MSDHLFDPRTSFDLSYAELRNLINSKRNAQEKELHDLRLDQKHGIGRNKNVLFETNPLNKFGNFSYSDNGHDFSAFEPSEIPEAEPIGGQGTTLDQKEELVDDGLTSDDVSSDDVDDKVEEQSFSSTSAEDSFAKSLKDLNVSELKKVEQANGLETTGARQKHEERLLEYYSSIGNDERLALETDVGQTKAE